MVFLLGNLASLGGFALGVTLGWNSSAGEVLRNNSNASGTEIGLAGGILNGGACVGVMFMPLFIKYFSRITAMSLTMPGFIVGWTFVCCAGAAAGQKVCRFTTKYCIIYVENTICIIEKTKLK